MLANLRAIYSEFYGSTLSRLLEWYTPCWKGKSQKLDRLEQKPHTFKSHFDVALAITQNRVIGLKTHQASLFVIQNSNSKY